MPTAKRNILTAFRYMPTALRNILTAKRNILTAFRYIPTAKRNILTAFRYMPTTTKPHIAYTFAFCPTTLPTQKMQKSMQPPKQNHPPTNKKITTANSGKQTELTNRK
jgi:hypothetical protein